jgi:hypothetical protein
LFIEPCSLAQTSDENEFHLFGSDEVLEVSLKFDITTLKRKKPVEEYMDAELVFHLNSRDSLVNNIRLRGRGHSRRDICILPPIRLNFKDCENRPADLEGVSNVKLVTHCKDNSTFENYLLKEYLAYKLYNVVTDTSFRVRLLKINYIDTGGRGFDTKRYGIAIEPVDVLEKRLNAVERENVVVRTAYINTDNYDKLCLFQYMIGNDDWYLANLHNLKLIEPAKGNISILATVPYDFDYSGLVDAYYAIPSELFDREEVTDRVYIGPCREDHEIRKVMDFFLDRKEEFYKEIEKMDLLDHKQKKRVLKYIDSFYDEYKRDELFYHIKSTCFK